MAVMPGAQWRPLPNPSKTPMARYDLFLIHTMVGSLEGTDGYFRSGKTSSNSHFGVGGNGLKRQWIDTAVRSAANGAGNHRSITSENADMGPEFAPWNTNDGNAVPALTPEQVEANAEIAAWAHLTHGVPLVAADTSRPNARGIGYHRLGCNPWRVSDGELWSSANGKVCPGPRRIAQIPQIIARARQIAAGQSSEEIDMTALYDTRVEGRNLFDWFIQLRGELGGQIAVLTQQVAALSKASGAQAVDPKVIADALKPVLAEAVAAGMAADNQAQADEIVDRLAARLANPAA